MHRERFKDFVLTEWHILDILSELLSLPFYLSVRNLLFLLLSKSKRLMLRWASTVCNEDFFLPEIFCFSLFFFKFHAKNSQPWRHDADCMVMSSEHFCKSLNKWPTGKKNSMMTLKKFSRILMWSSHVLVLWHPLLLFVLVLIFLLTLRLSYTLLWEKDKGGEHLLAYIRPACLNAHYKSNKTGRAKKTKKAMSSFDFFTTFLSVNMEVGGRKFACVGCSIAFSCLPTLKIGNSWLKEGQ